MIFSLVFLGSLGMFGYGGLLLEPGNSFPPPAAVQHSDATLYLPQSTLGYLSLVDAASLNHDVAETQLWKLIAQSPTLGDAMRRELKDLDKELQKDNVDLFRELRRNFSGPITLALLDFEPEQAKDGQPLHIALLASLASGSQETLRKLIQDKLRPQIRQESGSLRWEEVASGPVPFVRIHEAEKVIGAYALYKDRFLFVTHEQDLVPLSSPSSTPLAQAAQHKQLEAELQGADVTGYLDIARLLLRIVPSLEPSDARTARTFLRVGLSDLYSATYTAVPAREGYVERFALHYQANSQKPLVRFLTRMGASSLHSLQQIPPQTSLLLATHVGPVADLYQDFLKLMAEDSPEQAARFREDLLKDREASGFDPEKDVIDQLSGEFALAVKLPNISANVLDNPMIALGYLADTYLSVYIGVNDEKKADELVRKLLAKAEVTVTSEPYRNVDIAYLTSTNPIPVIPTYTLHDGLLAFHLNGGTAKACIDAKLDGKDLRTDPDFQRSTPGPEAGSSFSVSYLRLSDLVPLLARLARREAQSGAATSDPKSLDAAAILGEVEQLGKQLYGFSARSRAADGLLLHESYAPVAMSGGMSLLSGVGVVAGLTAFAAGQLEASAAAAAVAVPEPTP